MKKALLIAACLLAGISIHAQAYVNQRQTLGYVSNIYTGIFPTDSCLYLKGVYRDSAGLDGTYFARFSLSGELVWKTEYVDTLIEYSAWLGRIVQKPAGNFVLTGVKIDRSLDTTQSSCWLAEYTPTGVLVRSGTFNSPYFSAGKSFIFPTSIALARNGDYLIGGNISEIPTSPKSAFVARVDTSFSLKWITPIGGSHWDACYSVAERADGVVIAGGNEADNWLGTNMTNRHVITALDSTGQQQLWQWKYPDVFIPEGGSIVRDLMVLPDGSMIGATSTTREQYINSETNFVYESPMLIELNPDRTVAWKNKMGNQFYTNFPNHLMRISPALDDSGYVSAGNVVAFPTDTSEYMWILGAIQKISNIGDSVWLSYLYYPTNGEIPDHEIYDMVPDSVNNGYWLCGQAIQFSLEDPIQQGWLLFVDQYGCAVPGCRTVSTTEGTPLVDKILIYPNPASDYAAIWHSGHTFSKGQFRIVNEQGQLMQAWTAPVDELTTMIDVSGYTPGVYVLVYEDTGGAVTSKSFVVVR